MKWENDLPKILHMTDSAVIILCEYVPNMQKKEQEVQLMQQTEAAYCRPYCGYYRDAALRKAPNGGEFKLTCINPNHPALPQIKRQLGIS